MVQKTLINVLPNDGNGEVNKINKMPNQMEDILVWKGDLIKKLSVHSNIVVLSRNI